MWRTILLLAIASSAVDAYTVYMCTITTTGCSTGYYGYNTGLNSLFGLGGYQTYYLYPSTSLYGFGGFGGYYGGFGGYYPYNYYVPTIPQVTNVPTIGSVPNINTVPNIGGTTATGPYGPAVNGLCPVGVERNGMCYAS